MTTTRHKQYLELTGANVDFFTVIARSEPQR
jgi:hypothetical protein